jgi:hypothetical protein
MTLLDEIRQGSYRPARAGGPPAVRGPFRQTLAGIARRCLAGEDFRVAAREFIDEFVLLPLERRYEAIEAEPPVIGDPRFDAYLGALAEHLAVLTGLQPPAWSLTSDRFLDRFWFVSPTPGFRAISLAQAPAAFKRRGILIPERSLRRV